MKRETQSPPFSNDKRRDGREVSALEAGGRPLSGMPIEGMKVMPRVLRLTLKRRWFNMVASGEKKEEYRTPAKWILSRLEGKTYDRVEFRNGYSKTSPVIECEYLGWNFGFGKAEWGGGSSPGNPLVVIMLGKLIAPSAEVAP